MAFSDLYIFDKNYNQIVSGVDEAGRGPLAGPVVSAAVVFKKITEELYGINDSKKLSEKKREQLYSKIIKNCYVGVGISSVEEIDEINILNATFLSMRRALEVLKKQTYFDIVLVDGNKKIKKYNGNQIDVVKGDSKSLSIAAASIIAKVTRDRIMKEYAKNFPEYFFEKHKGYGTKLHREIILKNGITILHRKTFLKKILTV